MSYMTFPHKNNHYFRKEFLYDTFFYSVRIFARMRQLTLLLQILGGRMHGPSPTSNFGGTVPPAPLGLRPWIEQSGDSSRNRSLALVSSFQSLVWTSVYSFSGPI